MSGITITADSGTEFTANAAEWNSVCRLDDNNYVVAYRDNNDGNKGKVNVGSRTGTSVSVNEANAVVFNNDATDLITVRALSATKIVISYRDVNSGKGYVICATISGSTITLGTAVTDGVSQINGLSVAVLNDSNFVYARFYSTCFYFVCSVSGTTITMGSYQQGATCSNGSSVGLDGTHFVSVYRNSGIKAQAGTVNIANKTITFGSETGLVGSAYSYENYPVIDKFDSQHFVIAVRDEQYDFVIKVVAASINLTTLAITGGNALSTSPSDFSKSNFSICAITAYNFILSYYTTTGTQAELLAGTLTGSATLAWDAQGAVVFDNGTCAYTALCRLTDSYFIVGYKSG